MLLAANVGQHSHISFRLLLTALHFPPKTNKALCVIDFLLCQTYPKMSSAGTSSSNKESESPPAKRALLIDSSSIEPITRQQNYSKSRIQEMYLCHKWNIENFSYYCMCENSVDKFPSFLSSNFAPLSNDKLKFRLSLFPNGFTENNKNYISLILHLDNSDWAGIALKYKFMVIDSNGYVTKSKGGNKEFCQKNYTGFPKFCRRDILDSSSTSPGDVLTVYCKIYYEETVNEASVDDLNKIALSQLEHDCLQLLHNPELSDVVLVFGDGKYRKEFAVHAAILGARSEVFAAMFEHNMKEKNKRLVEITDVDADVGQELLKYLYCQNQFRDSYAERLLPIADKYQLHSLKVMCEDALCFKINPESVGNILLLADMHQADKLKSKCIDYIHCHSNCVLENKSIQNMKVLMQSRPELYYELFKQIPQDSCHAWFPSALTCDPNKLSWSYTSSSVSKCSKLWTIGQFVANHLSVDKYTNAFMETSTFPSPKSNSSVEFSVKLFSSGENDDCQEHLSLHLQLKCDEKMKVAVKVKASIMVNDNSAKGYTLEICKKLSNGESIGWPKFITQEQLRENYDLLLNGNDQLVLLFEVFYIENIDKPVTVTGVNTFADEHKFSIARDLSQFYSSQKLTDIVFSLGHKKLHAHKSIVAARSSVFARMFDNTNRVQIKDVDDVEAFEQVLALVYGQTETLTQWAHKMLPLVDKFKLDSLRQVCQIALCDQLDDTNIAQFLLLADKHKASMLKAKAFEYIRRKHSVLTQNDSLKVIQQQNPNLFHELLCYKLDNWKYLTDK